MSKYRISRHFPVWFEFGRQRGTPTLVDIAAESGGFGAAGDVLIRVPKDQADAIIEARNHFVTLVGTLLMKHPECIPEGAYE